MLGCFRSCLGRAVTLALLLAAAYAGWRWGPVFFPRMEEWLGRGRPAAPEAPGPSPELADSTLGRVQSLLQEGGEGRLALGGDELTSVLRYVVPGLVPEGIQNPEVRLREGRILLRARVALGALRRAPELGPVLGMLPDTADVEMEALLMPFGEEEAVLLVQRVQASRIPLPRRLIPEILRAMGRQDRPGLPPEGLVVPLPGGLGSAYIVGDSLILTSGS